MNKIKMFFSLSPIKSDIDAIKIKKPKYLLLSYGLWRDADIDFKMIKLMKKKGHHYKVKTKYKEGVNSLRNILNEFHSIGYYPKIILDSGAFSFKNTLNPTVSIREYFSDILAKHILQDYYEGFLDNEEIEFMEDDGVIFNFNENELISVSFSNKYLAKQILNIIDSESYYNDLYINSLYTNFIDHIRFNTNI